MIANIEQQLAGLFNEQALFEAWQKVAAKHSAPGFDQVRVEDICRNPGAELRRLRSGVISGRYQPSPLLVFTRPKANGRHRRLNIATLRDRIVARVLCDALVTAHDRELAPQSYAYRPRRGALKAISAAQKGCRDNAWVVRVDIADFFDRLDHGIMHETLERFGWDASVIRLIERLMTAPRFDGLKMVPGDIGVPQGLCIAPVLSNLYLDSFDRDLNDAGAGFIRYADDIVAFARDEDGAAGTLALINQALQQVKLNASVDKTRVYRVADGFLFLGFLFKPEGHVPGNEARTRLNDMLDDTPYTDESCDEFMVRRESMIRGWRNYYGDPDADSRHSGRHSSRPSMIPPLNPIADDPSEAIPPSPSTTPSLEERTPYRPSTPSADLALDLPNASDWLQDRMESLLTAPTGIRHADGDPDDTRETDGAPDVYDAAAGIGTVVDTIADEIDIANDPAPETEVEMNADTSPATAEPDIIPADDRAPAPPNRETGPDTSKPTDREVGALTEIDALQSTGRYAESVYPLRRLINADDEPRDSGIRRACMQRLAVAYEKLGLPGAARRCRRPTATESELAAGQGAPSTELACGARDVENWLDLFGGDQNHGGLARQFVDRLGRHGFRPMQGKLTGGLLGKHWSGTHTLAVPVFSGEKDVRFGVMDLDISRQVLDHAGVQEREHLREKLLDDARAILDRAHQAGVKGLIEDSGYKGYHVWFFMHTPIDAALMSRFLLTIEKVSGPPPAGTHRERFPAAQCRPADGLGCWIKLPLGLHRLTERRSRFLAPDGQPCANGIEMLGLAFRNKAGDLRSAITQWTRDTMPANADASATATGRQDNAASEIVQRCAVLQALNAKAQREQQLSHAERAVVRGILLPVEDGGRDAIHAILKHCANYSRTMTDKNLARPAHHPLGCQRIREILGEFCVRVGCNCRFRPRKGDYANPLRLLQSTDRPPKQTQPDAAPRAAKPVVKTSPVETNVDNARIANRKDDAGRDIAADIPSILAEVHAARTTLLKAQANLVAMMGGQPDAPLPFGRLRNQGPDPAIMRWVIET